MSIHDKLAEKEKEFKEKFGGGYWNPETDGEIVEGKVVELGTEKTAFRKDQPYLVIDTGKSKVKVYCNALLETLCTEEDVSVGNTVAIKYLGSRKSSKTGKTYKNYVLAKEDVVEDVTPTEEEKKAPKGKKSIF